MFSVLDVSCLRWVPETALSKTIHCCSIRYLPRKVLQRNLLKVDQQSTDFELYKTNASTPLKLYKTSSNNQQFFSTSHKATWLRDPMLRQTLFRWLGGAVNAKTTLALKIIKYHLSSTVTGSTKLSIYSKVIFMNTITDSHDTWPLVRIVQWAHGGAVIGRGRAGGRCEGDGEKRPRGGWQLGAQSCGVLAVLADAMSEQGGLARGAHPGDDARDLKLQN